MSDLIILTINEFFECGDDMAIICAEVEFAAGRQTKG